MAANNKSDMSLIMQFNISSKTMKTDECVVATVDIFSELGYTIKKYTIVFVNMLQLRVTKAYNSGIFGE